ncbi:MAG TPA: aminomethyl-transferring glycine dehydrogenase [Bacteroidota bacterium]|nr:aminomethyl-transferring glycine dehydrogenase [Bacteroidota bacterium]
MSIPRFDPVPFSHRHIGPGSEARKAMLKTLGSSSLDDFIGSVIPPALRARNPLALAPARSEQEVLASLRQMASKNLLFRSFIGTGYSDTITPEVILRNILENPGWYTAYTPYQAEIAQGRLEALLNFQTMIIDLTALDVANASLLDESTAAAEAMTMFYAAKGHPKNGVFFVSEECHPQNIEVIHTRAHALGIRIVIGDFSSFEFSEDVFGAILQYPASDGAVHDYTSFCDKAHAVGALVVVAADLMSLLLLKAPGEFGADAAVGSTQRFGIPLGYGGPHAAYFATRDAHKRHMPGRIIGVSVDSHGKRALRMALQTREQHIRREKATSNVCTSQVLLAVMAGMYAVYHGPEGLRTIAERIHSLTRMLAAGVTELGHRIVHDEFFDTLRIRPSKGALERILAAATGERMNFRVFADRTLGIALDEVSDMTELKRLLGVFAGGGSTPDVSKFSAHAGPYEGALARKSDFLRHPVFNMYHSETSMLRYMHALEAKDLALNVSMIPLGSCTMKLNATAEMIPVTWPELSRLHPFAPAEQAAGYHELFSQLEAALKEITGFAAISLQPNAGAQGEYTGLLVIRAYHASRGQSERKVCLIPSSAHGTNPASAVMAGMDVVVVACDERGNIDLVDLRKKAETHAARLAALMVTYPSTHGVFEESIRQICDIVHTCGGQVYMDGANMNAQVGLCRPAELGADVCHLNLHKTFCIPHGGGGPGMGPIGVAEHLAPYLPGHPLIHVGGSKAIGPVSAAPFGSAGIVAISWAYIAMMGGAGLKEATIMAILNANYMAQRLDGPYEILYRGVNGRVAHEFIVDLRAFKTSAGIEAEDVAKRLMDYGFHAPTVSFPVAGTLMIEPTESESKEELDRFCDAMIAIREEIREIEEGRADRTANVLKNAPHTASAVASDSWSMPYGREKAAFPTPYVRANKFWPAVGRVNNAYGDRNLICSCPPIEEYAEETK